MNRNLQKFSFSSADQISLCSSINMSGVVGSGYIAQINNLSGNYVSAGMNMTSTNDSSVVIIKIIQALLSSYISNTVAGLPANTSNLQTYITQRLAPYFVFLAFGILSIFGFFTYCTSCCCPCCCCKKTSEGNCCRFLSVIMILLLAVASAIICIYGLTYAM